MPDSPNPQDALATKALETLTELDAAFKALDKHDLQFVVTSISDNREDGSATHNFYISITTTKPA